MSERRLIFLLSLGLIFTTVLCHGNVIISEFMAINNKTITNAVDETSDWIEIHNDSSSSVNLTGWYLTDDDSELDKWQFPSTNIAANGYLLIWADKSDDPIVSNELHTNFKLGGGGEYLALIADNGTTVLHEYTPEYPDQKKDISYGIWGAGLERYFSVPTPGAANTNAFAGFAADTKFSHNRGFYSNAFYVAITCSTTNAVIRYTTDGSTPSETHGTVYTQPVHVVGTTILRATATKPGYEPSDVDTQTYLFLSDILQQDGSGLQSYANWGHSGPDWEVDPSMTNSVITDSHGRTFRLADALLSVPTVSLVTDWDNWWSDSPGPTLPDGITPWLGIYADTVGQNAVRRPVSMEFFTPDGAEEFALNGSVHIVGAGIGGTSARRWKTDKLSMRVSFKEEYGPKQLKYPVFGKDAAGKFKTLVLDAHMNWTWTHSARHQQRNAVKFIQDAFVSDLQNSLTETCTAPHDRFVHLFLNGLYWGMYDMHERPDEHFAEEYFGGDNDDYDSIKHLSDDIESADANHDGDGYNDNITNGDDNLLLSMLALSRKDLSQQSNYDAVVAVLDIDHFIDYMLPNFYAGNNDWAHKNWYATRDRVQPGGRWRYHSWDAEHVLESYFNNSSVSGAVNRNVTGKDDRGGPSEVHQNLRANAEYRLLFADHIHRHFFNGGALTPTNTTAIFQSRIEEVEWAVLGEAARWADNSETHSYSEWRNHMDELLTIYFPNRSAKVLSQLKSKNLYPDTPAPEFLVNGTRRHGKTFTIGETLTFLSSDNVYYTLDGSDPRQPGTGNAVGTLYSTPVPLTHAVRVKARARDGGEWSALTDAVFTPTLQSALRITEIMYNPRPPAGSETNLTQSASDFEFIELRNTGTQTLGLAGLAFTAGIRFDFANASKSTLAPGEYALVVRNTVAFTNRYPAAAAQLLGQYQRLYSLPVGNLSDGGEKIILKDGLDRDIAHFTYGDSRGWPLTADGGGHSLIPLSLSDQTNRRLSCGKNWRASSYRDGSPGLPDPTPVKTVLLNEIAAHTDYSNPAHPEYDSNDWIELFNTTTSSVTLDNWYLSDDIDNLKKWAIPATNNIAARSWLAFDELTGFHSPINTGFGLNKAGEQLFLSYLPGTAQDRVADAIQFKGQENDVTLGRYADGESDWRVTTPTRNAANVSAAGDLTISDIIYHPTPTAANPENNTNDEYIELHNPRPTNAQLWTDSGSWRINGEVDYLFPSNTTLIAGAHVRVVSFDPQTNLTARNDFLTAYGLTNGEVRLFGPYKGQLNNNFGRLALERPQAADLPGDSISWVIVDEVFYFDSAPVFNTNPFSATNGVYDEAYSDTIAGSATDKDGDTLTYAKTSGPAWLSVAGSGALSGTPHIIGTNEFTVTADDGHGNSDTAILRITIERNGNPPAFTHDPFSAANGVYDEPYSGTIAGSATDPDAGDTLTYAKTAGPAWLNVAGSGALSGTPHIIGTNEFTVTADDGHGNSDTAILRITIERNGNPPAFIHDPFSAADGVYGESYSGTIAGSATDPDAGDTLTYAKTAGPAWLSVAGSGALSGTPHIIGTNEFTVTVNDGHGNSDTATLRITVGRNGNPPAFTHDPFSAADGVYGESYSGTITDSATDPDAGDTLTYAKTAGPAWLSVAGGGTLSGTPNVSGTNEFTVTVDDGHGNSDTATLRIAISTPATATTPVTSGLYLELIADDLALSDGDAVSSWVDSASGNALTSSGSARPKFHENFANDHAAVRFDGVNDLLQNTWINTYNKPDCDSLTLFVVAKYLSYPGSTYLFSTKRSGNDRLRIYTSDNHWGTRVGSGAGRTGGYFDTEKYIFTVLSGSPGANDVSLSASGEEIATTYNGNGEKLQCINICAFDNDNNPRRFANADVAEVLLYNRALSNSEIDDVEEYLAIKYLIPVTDNPPSFTHDPFYAPNGVYNSPYSGTIAGSATDPDAGDTLEYWKWDGPNWLNIADDGSLSGTPDKRGTNIFEALVYDHNGRYDIATLKIIIGESGNPPSFTHDPFFAADGVYGESYSGTIAGSATDPDTGDTLKYRKIDGPSWLTVADNGSLSGTPDTRGTNIFEVGVSDANSHSDSAILKIAVSYSSNDTTPVTDGLYLELIADDLAIANGAAVSRWVDSMSGNALTLTDGAGTAPSFVSGFANGHDAVRFDGVNDHLEASTLNSIGVPDTDTLTLFVVAKYLSLPSGTDMYYLLGCQAHSGGNGRLRLLARPQYNRWDVRIGGGGQFGGGTLNTNLNIFTILSGQSGDLVKLYTNNQVVVTGDNGSGLPLPRFSLGANGQPATTRQWGNVDIAEVLLYNRALNNAELTSVYEYLAEKYIGPGPGPIHATSISLSDGVLTIGFDSLNGIEYRLFDTSSLTSPIVWTDTGVSPVIGNGNTMRIIYTPAFSSKTRFFHVRRN